MQTDWTCSLFVGVTMISMATERSAFQTICAITTMAVAIQRYVKVFFIIGKSNEFFFKYFHRFVYILYANLYSLNRNDFTTVITWPRPTNYNCNGKLFFSWSHNITKFSFFHFRLIVLLWPLVSITARVREGTPGTGCSVYLPSTN